MTDIDPHDHGEDAARDEYRFAKLHEYDDLDPRDLPCDILCLLDDVFTFGDSLYSNDWTTDAFDEEYDAYRNKIDNVERKISAQFFKPIPDVANMLFRWQNDKTIRLAIFCNKDNGNVEPSAHHVNPATRASDRASLPCSACRCRCPSQGDLGEPDERLA